MLRSMSTRVRTKIRSIVKVWIMVKVIGNNKFKVKVKVKVSIQDQMRV